MRLPPGNDDNVSIVKLNKSIYGLKKSPKYWNLKFDKVIAKKGFNKSKNDFCLYCKLNSEYKIYLLLFVDDILIIGTNDKELHNLKLYLSNIFSMKDLGYESNYLGINVKQDLQNGIIEMSQKHYLKRILEVQYV